MNSFYQNIYWIKRYGHTTRFHGMNPLTRPDTVFHHSASVALILLQVAPSFCTVNLLKAALLHDMPEGITGDIPGNIKWLMKEDIGDIELDVLHHHDIDQPELNAQERILLKSADCIDTMFTCLMERMRGNTEVDLIFHNYVEGYRKGNWFCHAYFVPVLEELMDRYPGELQSDHNHELAARFIP